MKNRVGDKLPTMLELQNLANQVKALRANINPFTIKLSAAERKRLAHLRAGGEQIIALVADLSAKYNIQLADASIDGMNADLTLAQRLAPLASELSLLAEEVNDTLAAAQSEAWQAATCNYSVLARVSKANPSLQSELAPARAFFAKRRKKSAKSDKSDEPKAA